MNRSFIVAVLTVAMIIMSTAVGHTLAVPHDFYCDNCHGKHTSSGTLAATYACLGCHNSAGQASRMPINQGDMSNYFNINTQQPAGGSRSSHTYMVPTPYSPAAKVQDPTDPAMVTSAHKSAPLTARLACSSCHIAAATTNAGDTKPLLRISKTNDAICIQCHAPRNVTSHTNGSHPVFSRAYSSVYKSNTTAYRKVPLSANPNNRTADLGSYLASGKVACSTCHAPHYADSSSATLDNRSTASGFAVDDVAKGLKGSMQNSKGQLLRTDPIGASANAINICSNCHKETANKNHNGNNQNVQCNHCHGAHVDWAGSTTPPAGEATPNSYLVRRDFSNISTNGIKLGANVKVIYNTATSLRFKRADGKGICQICHTPTPGVAIHDQGDVRKENCIACHKHSNGFSVSDCSSCHGQPPAASYVGGPKGKSSASYSLDESFTPHVTHADAGYYKYACKNCHYDGTKPGYHNTGSSFSDVFIDTTGSIGDQPLNGLAKNVAGDFNLTTKTCANVYCHSNGNPRGSTIDWKSPTHETPTWINGKNTIVGQATECSTCHDSAALATNAHAKHVATNNIKCYVCHAATATESGAIADRSKHANGSKDVTFVTRPTNYKSVFSATFNNADATCTASCHTNGIGGNPVTTPKWTDVATGQCGSCHAASPTTTLHPLHFDSAIGPKLGPTPDCASCHDYADGAATHANGVINLKPGNTCAPCHPTTSSTPIWSTAATVSCESCHIGTASQVLSHGITYVAPLKDLNATVGHGQYSSVALSKVRCTTCHNAAANHIGDTSKRLLVAGNGLCDTCHTTAANKGLPATRVDLPVHGGSVNKFFKYTSASNLANIAAVRADSCAGCHDTHGTANRMNVRTVINGLTVAYTGSSPQYITTTPDPVDGFYHGLCQVCHTRTKYFNRDTAPATLTHASGGCLDCHKHKATPVAHYAFEPGGTCDGCHGYPPVETQVTRLAGTFGTQSNYSSAKYRDYTGGGGAHSVAGHIPKTAVAKDLWVNCTNCHISSSHNTGGVPAKQNAVNVVVDPKFKFNNDTPITYNANTCSNVSCHFKPSPNWTNGL